MANFWGVGVPSAILGALGTGEEQRARTDRLAALEAQQRYQAERLGLDRETLAETRRQADLRYGPATVNVPGIGEITAQREFIPAIIAAASAREREVSPTELGTLGTIRERIVNPQVGGMAEAEAAATRKAFPQFAGETSALNVDLPQDIRLPRTSVEKLFTEAGAQRKEVDLAAGKQKQGLSNARYRQLYSLGTSQGIPHAVADATAIAQATREFGIAPEREAFVAEPRPEQKMTLDDEYLKALQTPEGERSEYEKAVVKQYQTNKERERAPTLVDLAIRASKGDAAAKRALDTYQRSEPRERDAAWSKATTILSQARNIRAQEQGRFGKIIMDPVEEENVISRIANQLAVGTGDPLVQEIVRGMVGGLGGGMQPPGLQPPAAPPGQPRPAPAVRPLAPTGGPETLSRRDPRYGWAQGQGMSDAAIQQKYGVRIVD